MMRLITRNLGWKLVSLGLAFLLWLALSGARESTASITAPVQYRNIPKSLEISSEMIEQVHLILRGPSLKLSRLTGDELPLIIDLARVQGPGESTLTIGRENVELPAGVTLERSIPSQVRLHLETRVARSVPVVVRHAHLPEGMEIVEEQAIPARLTVIGPESRVARIEAVVTDPVDLRTLNARGEAVTTAFAGDPQVHFTASPIVTARVTLAPAPPKDEGVTKGKKKRK